jgi:hypothetical protein
MHYLDDETEQLLIWLWSNGGSGVWDGYKGRTVTVLFSPDLTFGSVKRKHLQQLAGSKGYGGVLAKLGHQGDERWQKVTVTLTDEGQRWADSPYLRSQYLEHPGHPEIKAAKAKAKSEAEAASEQQATLARMQEEIDELTFRLLWLKE